MATSLRPGWFVTASRLVRAEGGQPGNRRARNGHAAYRENWDSQVHKLFEELPEPGDHPTFVIEAVDD